MENLALIIRPFLLFSFFLHWLPPIYSFCPHAHRFAILGPTFHCRPSWICHPKWSCYYRCKWSSRYRGSVITWLFLDPSCVCNITVEARKMAWWKLGTFKDRSPLTMITLFNSMVSSKLECCCPVWDPPNITDIQRQFTRRIIVCKDLNYWQRLNKLKLISFQRRGERYSIIQVWKIYNIMPHSHQSCQRADQ